MRTQLLLAVMLACSAASAAPSGVTMTVTLPAAITMSGSGPSDSNVAITVTNTTGAPVPLTVSDTCGIIVWRVLDAKGQVIENQPACPAGGAPQTYNLPAAGRLDNATIVFDSAKYHTGETYTLRYRYWGLDADTTFEIARS